MQIDFLIWAELPTEGDLHSRKRGLPEACLWSAVRGGVSLAMTRHCGWRRGQRCRRHALWLPHEPSGAEGGLHPELEAVAAVVSDTASRGWGGPWGLGSPLT